MGDATPFTLKIKSKSATMQKSAFINNGKTCENRWFMMLETTMETKMFTKMFPTKVYVGYLHSWVRYPKEKLTPNILRKSGSLKRKGIFDT